MKRKRDNPMTLISVTRLRLRSVRYLPEFIWLSLLSLLQAKRASGNLKTQLVRDAHLTFWTLTAWENEAAMRLFMTQGSHRRAMPKLLEWCDEASVVHWTQETAELPNLKEAHRRIQTEGRMSRVNHPSPAQMSKQIAEPKIKM
jgi:heme-degrading monooxygenase HmoA